MAHAHRASRHAVGHADRAINHLRDEAYDHVKKYVFPHGKVRRSNYFLRLPTFMRWGFRAVYALMPGEHSE